MCGRYVSPEEAAGKPLWRHALRNPAGRQVHQPYFIHSPTDSIIAIAGLWSLWMNHSGDPVLSCALLTRTAAPSLEHIHHRMPWC